MISNPIKSEHKPRKITSLIVIILFLFSITTIIISILSPSAEATVHGILGASSTFEENTGPNDADSDPFTVTWAAGSDHYIEGNYTVSPGISLIINPGCNIFFNGSYSIFVTSMLYAQGTSGSRITFTSNSSAPGPGNWSSIDFSGGGGAIEFCTIQFATYAINLDTTIPVLISENLITDNIVGVNGSHPQPTFTNNNISNNLDSGIRIQGLLSGLTFSAAGNTILNNSGAGGIDIFSDFGDVTATITDNEISDNFDNGIIIFTLIGDITATINGNTIDRNGFEGIFLIAEGGNATLDATILNNNLTDNVYGIWLTDDYLAKGTSFVVNISSNNIIGNGDGIYVDGWCSIDAEIWNNNFTGNPYDVINCMIDDSDSKYRIIDNLFLNNDGAIYLSSFYYTPANRTLVAEITDNIMINNSNTGIDILSDENMDLTIERNVIAENGNPLWTTAFEKQTATIRNNTFVNNVGMGMEIEAFETISLQIEDNEVKNSTDDNLYIYASDGGEFNIINNDFSDSVNSNGVNFDYFNGSGIFKDNIANNNALNGIYFWEANDITVINSTFNNNMNGLRGYKSIVNVTNSTISSSLNDFYLDSNSHFIALNTSFDNTSAVFGDALSDLTVKWFLDVEVVDTDGSGVDNADVFVNDSFGKNEWMGNTKVGNSGWVYLIPSTEYIQNSTTKNFTTPHNVSAQRGPEKGFSIPKIWKSRNVTVTINSEPSVDDIMPYGGIPQFIFRGDTIFIYANSSDFTDPEDQLTPYLEYRDPNDLFWNITYFSGPTMYFGSSPSGFWEIPFSPPLDALTGWYDFRVRFGDTAGVLSDYFYANNSVHVGNYVPDAISLDAENGTVFRDNPLIIYASGFDREDNEDDLIPSFHYRLNGTINWLTSYFNSAVYSNGRWEITFSPLVDAQLGTYDFRVQFSDSEGDLSNWLYEYNLVDVQNNPPISIDISSPQSSMLRTQTMYIYANGYDSENWEGDLTPYFEILEPQETMWGTNFLFNSTFVSGVWQIEFSPTTSAKLGTYDFRVRFSDLDSDYSYWIYYNDTVFVTNNLPIAEDIQSSFSQVMRGNGAYIFANGSDIEDLEGDLVPEFSYRISEGAWDNTSFSGLTYTGSEWRITFSPPQDMKLGDYEFQVGFFDSDGDFSQLISLSQVITVINNLPLVISLDILPSDIYRTESVLIYATGEDVEDPLSILTPTFEYKHSNSSGWDELTGWSFNSNENRFEVSFTPSASFDKGNYDFRVKFTDLEEDGSDWEYLYEGLLVKNNVPSVLNFTMSSQEVFRGESILLYANAEDADKTEDDLIPTFEYKLAGGSPETAYLGTPQYTNGKWQVTFSPPMDANIGDYDFQVKFSDGDEESSWAFSSMPLNVKNNPPSVDIETTGSQNTKAVSFSASVLDVEDSLSDLTFKWNFGDGTTSSERNPTHTFDKSGSHTVTLTVTDKNGGETTDTTQIQIEVEAEPGSSGESEGAFPLWLLLIIIVTIVLILVLLLMKRKKPEVDVEAVEPESQPIAQAQVPSLPGDQQVTTPQDIVQPMVPQQPAVQPQVLQQRVAQPQVPLQQAVSPQVAPVPPPPAPKESTTSKNIRCPNCKQSFKADLKKGENIITCSHCQTKGKITL
jgi:PKD repeat protein